MPECIPSVETSHLEYATNMDTTTQIRMKMEHLSNELSDRCKQSEAETSIAGEKGETVAARCTLGST